MPNKKKTTTKPQDKKLLEYLKDLQERIKNGIKITFD